MPFIPNSQIVNSLDAEVAYAEFTSDVSITATTEGTANTIVTAPSFTADGVSAYLIEFYSVAVEPNSAVAGRSVGLWLYQDGASIGSIGTALSQVASITYYATMVARRRIMPAAGTHTYSIRGSCSAVSATVHAGVGGIGANTPGYIRISKIGGGSAASVPTDGWTDDSSNTWTYTSATTFTVTGDQTAKFSKGTRLKLTNSALKYFVVAGSSFGAGTTTVTVTGGDDYSLANAAISANYYSYAANPQGYPDWFNYTPSLVGWAATPTVTMKFAITGRQCHVTGAVTGTSNSTTTTFTLPLNPLSSSEPDFSFMPTMIQNNGAYNIGRIGASIASGNILTVGPSGTTDTWTNANGKSIYVDYFYTI